ncbi:hypothetical protein FQZ97_1013600 [compost metagenome]
MGANLMFLVCRAAAAINSSGLGMFSQICEACSEIIIESIPTLSACTALWMPQSKVCLAVRPGRM